MKTFKILPEFSVKNFKNWLTFEFPKNFEFIDYLMNNPQFNSNSKLGTVLSVSLNEMIFELPYRLSKRVARLQESECDLKASSTEILQDSQFANHKILFANRSADLKNTDKEARKRINFKDKERFNIFMEEYLGYRFTDVKLLMHAMTRESDELFFERLEFLGDAVIESMSLYIARKVLLKLKVSATPELLHSVKVIALSNMGLANLLIFHRLHRFITFPKKIERECYEYINRKSYNSLCKESNLREVEACPKFLGDSMEALCGAIFLDGGWEALISVFGRIAAPVIFFVCKYFDETVVDLIHDITAFYAQRGTILVTRHRLPT